MFDVSDETKAEVVAKMREILGDTHTDGQLEQAFDAAVEIVKRSFGF